MSQLPYRLPLTSDDPNDVMRRAITYAFAVSRMYGKADGGEVSGQNDYLKNVLDLAAAVGTKGATSVMGWPDKIKSAANSTVDAAKLPGDVVTGKVAPMSDEGVRRAVDLAKQMTLGAGAMEAPAGALHAGLMRPKGEGIIAYHGSPHSFDRFDLSKIGTGEGAQAYGHGLYFAESEDVAKAYRDQLSYANKAIDGKKFYGSESHAHSLLSDAMDAGGGIDDALKTAREQLADFSNGPNKSFSRANIARDAVASLEDWKARNAASFDKGSMYQVRINADPAHFLDWDRPLSEQSPVVQRTLGQFPLTSELKDGMSLMPGAKLRIDNDPDFGPRYFMEMDSGMKVRLLPKDIPNMVATKPEEVWGRNIVSTVASTAGSEAKASQALREAGIPGIKYLDQGSRGAGEGSRNYVVFDDKLIDILKKYAAGGDVSAPLTGQHTITLDDLIGRAPAPTGPQPGAYTDAGGQKIASPFVTSVENGYPVAPVTPVADKDPMRRYQDIFGRGGYAGGGDVSLPRPFVTEMSPEGYPVFPGDLSAYGNIAQPYVKSFTGDGSPTPFDDPLRVAEFYSAPSRRRGYQEGGDPELSGEVTAAPDVREDDIARAEARGAYNFSPVVDYMDPKTIPMLKAERDRTYASPSEFIRHQLDTGERQLPQYDREAVEAWKEGAKSLGHMAAYGIPVVGPALGAYDLATAARDVASPEFRKAYEGGDYASMAATLGGLGLAALGAPGKAAKAAAAAGALLMPDEAGATFFGEAAKMAPHVRSGLEAAKRALVGGSQPWETWLEHGWAPDPAGKMVSEISDLPARLVPSGLKKFRGGEEVRLGEILSHPDLYEKYPSSYSRVLRPFEKEARERGYYNPLLDVLGSNVRLGDRDLLENLLHEHQHRIQHIEGMSPGTSPDIYKGPEHYAAPLVDDMNSLGGAIILKQMMEKDPSLGAIDALMRAKEAGMPIGPQPLKFISSPYEKLTADAANLQDKIEEIYRTTLPPYEQYHRSLGEWTARMPGERLEYTDPQRLVSYPFREDYPVIVRDPSSRFIKNDPGPMWEAERERALELARELQKQPLPSREGGGAVKGALKLLGKLLPEGSGYKSIPGKPAAVALPGIGRVEARPVPEIERAASDYMQSIGRPGEHEISSFAPFNPAFATKIGEAFGRMKHDPGDPAVRRAYDALLDETMAQYRVAKDTGIDFRFLKPGEADPYAASPALGYEDIVNRGRLVMFPTEQGFGSSGGLPADNPLLRRAGRVGDKENAVINDAFRIIHDLYGHFGPGNPFFRAPGEERAFQLHSKMFSPTALPAATAETRGQNSWLNYGPYGKQNRSAIGADTVFADQKIGRMPEWASSPAPAHDADVDEYVRSLIGRADGGEVDARDHMAGGGRLSPDAIKAAIALGERAANYMRGSVSPEQRMMVMHQVSPRMLPKIQEMGGMPAPSLGIGMAEHSPLESFGDVTLMGHPHLAMPNEVNPIYGQDVWTPTVPPMRMYDPSTLPPSHPEPFTGMGFFSSVKKRAVPGTAENVLEHMLARPTIGGEYLVGHHDEPDPSLGYVMSALAPRFKSLREMGEARGRLEYPLEFERMHDALMQRHDKLAAALNRGSDIEDEGENAGVDRLGRAILDYERRKGSTLTDPLKQNYPSISAPQREWFQRHVEDIRNFPTSYFEAKPRRIVEFGEFGGAAVPEEYMPRVSPILEQMGIKKIVPYSGERKRALEQFPELSFKSGGAPKDDLVSQALDFISRLSPVSEAHAESPTGTIIKALASKIAPTVRNLAREEPLFPGVYSNPRKMAEEAERRVAPEDPALKRLWGVNREDIYNIAGRRPGNAPPVLAPPPAKARGINYASEGVMVPENAARLIDILGEAEKQPGLRTGMMPWYYMDPVYNRLEQLFGPDEARNRFNLLNTSIALMSPSANVKSEINRGLGAYHLALQGKAKDFIQYGGNPKIAPEGTIPEYMRGILQGHKTHATSHGVPFSKYIETGDPGMQSPKVPLYIQSSGVPQTGFQTTLPVPDAHYTRILGMPDVRRTADPEVSMKMGEYRPVGPWFREGVAKPAGMEAVPAQALLWGAGSGQTGVRTAIGAPKIELLSQQIMDASRRHGVSPETARDLILSGTLYAKGGSVIHNALDVSSKVSRRRVKEAA